MRPLCLIVDDAAEVRFGIREFLEAHEFEVGEAASAEAGFKFFVQRRPSVVIVDFVLEDGTALDLIPRLKAHDENVPVIVLSGFGSIDRAVATIQLGAANFLTKPIDLPALLLVLSRLITNQRDTRRRLVREAMPRPAGFDPFVGGSEVIGRARREATLALSASLPILLLGESGTGKTLTARWLHQSGGRGSEPFVVLNCAAIPRELLEAELFGYQKGAFSGAAAAKPGLLELSDHGTLFLDEIGDLDLALQPKLLSAIEDKRFRRIGDLQEREVDVRIICATHQDLRAQIAAGKFRMDLFYRISAMPLHVPALRERREDIADLCEVLLANLARELNRPRLRLEESSYDMLRGYSWPGNVRELRNVLERAAILCEGGVIQPDHLTLPSEAQSHALPVNPAATLKAVEREHIFRVVRDCRGQVEKAARLLDIPRSTLYQKIKEYGIVTARGHE